MSYCINPECQNPQNPDRLERCQACGSSLIINERYQPIRPLDTQNGRTQEKQSNTRIYEIVDYSGKLRVLKVLTNNSPELVELFKREAEILQRLRQRHPVFPEVHGYFIFSPRNGPKELHCLVRDKIEGQNLEQWLKENRPISQALALNWLRQLVEILEQVHQNNFLHRDIKPSNIMRRPDEQLVLIDFSDVPGIVSAGYAPSEQAEGRAVPQSDFFALGRTLVHLLTGRHPIDLPKDSGTRRIIWRNRAPQVSKPLADLIDDLMAPLPEKRPQDAQAILQRLEKIGRPWRLPHLSGLAVGATLLLGLAVTGVYWYKTGVNGCSKIWIRSFPQGDNLSCGEEILVPDFPVPEKQAGVNALADGKYAEAVDWLEKARQKLGNDPETLIYLNNARLAAQKAEVYAIAVVAPISDKSLDTAQEILRGVAQAQEEFNSRRNPTAPGLKVLIADDANNPAQAKQIAEELVSKGDILAVVGNYASEVTLKALPVYQQHQLVLISPGSTSEDLSNEKPLDHVFFRTVPSAGVSAQVMASYLINQAHQKAAAVFYNPKSNYSKSIREQFYISFTAGGGKIVRDFDLSDPGFKPRAFIDQAQEKGATALVLLTDGKVSILTFLNVLQVIKANQGRYWMVGGWIVYGSETLQLVGSEALNRLVLVVPWHHLSSHNREFPQAAKDLWGGGVSGLTATAYDAARALITALEKQPQPTRISVQQALADPEFKATGATGEIRFRPNGDREENVFELVKVVPSKCTDSGFMFVPVDYPTAAPGVLECG